MFCQGIIIVDAGGGTIDVSTYAHVASTDANERFEEISVAQCEILDPSCDLMLTFA